jgi:hypothetical protein
VHSLAEVLLDDLYNWRDKDSVPEQQPTHKEKNKREGYEELGVIDGYHRPGMTGSKPKTRKNGTLTSVGEAVRDVRDDEVEMVIDLDSEKTEVKDAITFMNIEEAEEDDFEIEI